MKFEDGDRQFKERVEEWEKQASREKDALVELRERYAREWLEWEEKSQIKIKKLQYEHESKILRELEREMREKQLQLECRESDMEARALNLREGEQKLKQREIQFEWFEQWENNRRMQEEFEIRRAEDLKERKLWETDLRKREIVLSAKVEKCKEEKKTCESCLGARQEALLEAEAKFDERRAVCEDGRQE